MTPSVSGPDFQIATFGVFQWVTLERSGFPRRAEAEERVRVLGAEVEQLPFGVGAALAPRRDRHEPTYSLHATQKLKVEPDAEGNVSKILGGSVVDEFSPTYGIAVIRQFERARQDFDAGRKIRRENEDEPEKSRHSFVNSRVDRRLKKGFVPLYSCFMAFFRTIACVVR